MRLGEGLYYVNALEPVLSTMETETLAARNAVAMLLADKFSASICPPGFQSNQTAQNMPFVYGWDC
jgi:prenylcysteine oxidase/farnesylcysteine lyase